MLLNYLKIAWRNLRRNPVFALISIAGLALASCICIVVWLVCSYEFSFDTFHPNRDRIYRLTSRTDQHQRPDHPIGRRQPDRWPEGRMTPRTVSEPLSMWVQHPQPPTN